MGRTCSIGLYGENTVSLSKGEMKEIIDSIVKKHIEGY